MGGILRLEKSGAREAAWGGIVWGRRGLCGWYAPRCCFKGWGGDFEGNCGARKLKEEDRKWEAFFCLMVRCAILKAWAAIFISPPWR